MRSWISAGVLLAARLAFAAGPTFTDDFESGLDPAWYVGLPQAPQAHFEVRTTAAHVGDAGVRLLDQDTTAGSGLTAQLSKDLPGVTSEYHTRFWVRISPDGANAPAFTFEQLQVPSSAVMVSVVVNSNGLVSLQGQSAAGDFTNDDGTQMVADGKWHLIELAITGIGGGNGRRHLWVDGASGPSPGGLNYMAFAPDVVRIGSLFASNRGFTGNVDFDDFRCGPTRWSNVFVLDVPGPVAQGECVQATVRATTVDAPPASVAAMSVNTPVGLSALDGGVDFFSDPACASAVKAATVRSGTTSTKVYFKSRGEGAQVLLATNPDYLQGATPITTQAPIAKLTATPAMLPEGGGTSSLSSAGSTPSAGFSLTAFHWRLTQAPTGVQLAGGESFDVQLKEPGTYHFELVVEDSAGGVSRPAVATVDVPGEPMHFGGPVPGCGCAHGGGAGLALLLLLGLRRARSARHLEGTTGRR